MYKCPKCGDDASKERIKVQTYSEDFSVKTGDAKYNKCGFETPIKEFKND